MTYKAKRGAWFGFGFWLRKARGAPSPYGPELVRNGDGSSATDWGGAVGVYDTLVSSVGGELSGTIGAGKTVARVVQSEPTEIGATYRALAKTRCGAGATQTRFRASNNATLDGPFFASPVNTTTTMLAADTTFVATATTTYIGLDVSGVAGAVGYMDDVSLKKVL